MILISFWIEIEINSIHWKKVKCENQEKHVLEINPRKLQWHFIVNFKFFMHYAFFALIMPGEAQRGLGNFRISKLIKNHVTVSFIIVFTIQRRWCWYIYLFKTKQNSIFKLHWPLWGIWGNEEFLICWFSVCKVAVICWQSPKIEISIDTTLHGRYDQLIISNIFWRILPLEVIMFL